MKNNKTRNNYAEKNKLRKAPATLPPRTVDRHCCFRATSPRPRMTYGRAFEGRGGYEGIRCEDCGLVDLGPAEASRHNVEFGVENPVSFVRSFAVSRERLRPGAGRRSGRGGGERSPRTPDPRRQCTRRQRHEPWGRRLSRVGKENIITRYERDWVLFRTWAIQYSRNNSRNMTQ